MRRRRIALVQQGVWAMPLESMPLAVGYLKAAVDADETLRDEYETSIVNLRGGTSIGAALSAVFSEAVPDVLAISVFGWNLREALVLAETFKQLRPDGLAVIGGTHVANQGDRVFRLSPDVDVVVNGEGERTFPRLLHAWLGGDFPDPGGSGIEGISFRRPDGSTVTTAAEPRIQELETIVSPFLSGAVAMTDAAGRFRYDVALMETSRGCPYHCSFCYWGGAVGQKVRRFPRDRLVAELEVFAFHRADTVVLCDANFGMQAQDEEFLEDVIRLRERTGYPRTIESSWAKNKSQTFYRIVRRMKETGLHSSFTIALQTLNEPALREMHRRNMRLNEWRVLTEWLAAEGLECYAELIWGAPGETTASFLAGYDELAVHVPRIAVYPLMLLPNTELSERRGEYGLVTSRGQTDDFEHVLATDTMTFAENLAMQGFLLWARAAAENSFFRYIWLPLRRYTGLTQSQVIFRLAKWFDACPEEIVRPLRAAGTIVEPGAVNAAIRALFLEPRVRQLLSVWWDAEIRPLVPPEYRWLVDEVFRFDLATLPLIDREVEPAEVGERDGVRSVRRRELFALDVPAFVTAVRAGKDVDSGKLTPTMFDLRWRLGLDAHIDNHEMVLVHVAAVERSYARRRAGARRQSPVRG